MAKNKTTNKNARVAGRVRKIDNEIVKACLYNGRAVGHGCYFAGMVNNALIIDEAGRPIPFRRCGALVEA